MLKLRVSLEFYILLEQNLLKNISMWVTFLWQAQIQKIKYGLNDTKRINKGTSYIDTLVIYTIWYEFSNDFDAQRNFGKIFVTKNLLTWNILILSML